MLSGSGLNFNRDVATRVTARRQKVRMDDDFLRAALNQSRETLADIRVFKFEKGRFDQSEAATFSDGARGVANVVVRFTATTAVTNNQHTDLRITLHAAVTASAINAGSQYLKKLRACERISCAAFAVAPSSASRPRTIASASDFQ
jgi:hypothetical protein